MWFFQNPEIIFYHFFRIFNLYIFWVLILQKRIWSRYLVPVTPTTVLSRSFWNFTGALRMVWRYACGFFRILKLFFITGFLLQYLGRWYRTNGPLVNLPIFNTSNKNKAGDINSPWNLLVYSAGQGLTLSQLDACPTGDQEVAGSIPARFATFFHGDWSWNIFYGHYLPSTDSRWAVISFEQENVHKYLLTT